MHKIKNTNRLMKIGTHIKETYKKQGHVFEQQGLTFKCQNCDAKVVVDNDLQMWDISECIAFPCGDSPLFSCADMERGKISL